MLLMMILELFIVKIVLVIYIKLRADNFCKTAEYAQNLGR